MKKFLVDSIEAKNIISHNQFRFQRGKSTQDALVRFSKDLYNNLDQSNLVLSIFVDFSKDFDPSAYYLKR